jgi:hypothetical protein
MDANVYLTVVLLLTVGQNRPMTGLQVIGAGFGRTGTLSLRSALGRLGFGPTYHGEDIHFRPARCYDWQRVARGESVDWDEIYRGFNSALDYPTCCVWRQLADHWPDAKIVLTTRDPERWWRSTNETIYPARDMLPHYIQQGVPSVRAYVEWNEALVWDGLFDGRFSDRDHAIKVFEQHIADVKATADPERLLVFDVAQGWEPLCEFLERPVPDEPFPRLNDTAEMKRAINVLRIGSRVVPPLAAAGVAGGAAALARRIAS